MVCYSYYLRIPVNVKVNLILVFNNINYKQILFIRREPLTSLLLHSQYFKPELHILLLFLESYLVPINKI